MLGKKLIKAMLCLFLANVSAAQSKKPVFIISKHIAPSQAQAYSIDGNQVTLQANVDIDTYNQGYGAVGNAAWPEKDLMFVTYENSPMIVWASTKTLQKVGEFDTGVIDLSGITVDTYNEKLYIIQRNTDNFYVYTFDEPNNTLVLDNHYDLNTPSGYLYGWGLALDGEN